MMDITFEDAPWERQLQQLQDGAELSAARFLVLLEAEDEHALEDAFAMLASKRASLDLTTLPAHAVQGQAAVRLRQEQQMVRKGDLLSQLEETDPLRVYLQELADLPVAADVQLLARQLLQGDEKAANRLSELSLGAVVQLAQEYVGMGVLLLDLIQEGSMGLWQGILCYSGGDFQAHRDWWIRHFLTRAVIAQARNSGIGVKMRTGMEDYRDTDQKLLSELGRNPTVEEIAQAMHVTVNDAQVYADMLRFAQTDAKIKHPVQEDPREEEQAVEDTAYFQMRQRITQLLSVLPEQEAKLLTLRFGLEGGLPLSPEETGRKLGMTAQEVVASETAALSRLRCES